MALESERILDETYTEVLEEMDNCIELGRDIMHRLGPDGSLMFLKYEMSVCLVYANNFRKAIIKSYQQGLDDGKSSREVTT